MRLLNNKKNSGIKAQWEDGRRVGNLGGYVRTLLNDVNEERRLQGSSFSTKE